MAVLAPYPAYRYLIPAGDIGEFRIQNFRQIARCQFDIQPAFAAGNINGVKRLGWRVDKRRQSFSAPAG